MLTDLACGFLVGTLRTRALDLVVLLRTSVNTNSIPTVCCPGRSVLSCLLFSRPLCVRVVPAFLSFLLLIATYAILQFCRFVVRAFCVCHSQSLRIPKI